MISISGYLPTSIALCLSAISRNIPACFRTYKYNLLTTFSSWTQINPEKKYNSLDFEQAIYSVEPEISFSVNYAGLRTNT